MIAPTDLLEMYIRTQERSNEMMRLMAELDAKHRALRLPRWKHLWLQLRRQSPPECACCAEARVWAAAKHRELVERYGAQSRPDDAAI